jgi:isopentenyl phosphate kinase
LQPILANQEAGEEWVGRPFAFDYNICMKELVFLKLGGSLITDKNQPYTPQLDVMMDLALQIKTALQTQPELHIVLGHGAGSFGHVPASEYKTRDGLPPRATPLAHRERDANEENYWKGFAEVWYQASSLNRFLMKALHNTGLSTVALPPSASVIASNGQVSYWDTTPIRMALAAGIVPVIFGDTVFDEVRGGTILSTEDLFMHLTRALHPDRILLAGLEAAVWQDFPTRTTRLETITPKSFREVKAGVGKSAAVDVTGGMASKVRHMLELVEGNPDLQIQIFSGVEPGNLVRALTGETLGTVIRSSGS